MAKPVRRKTVNPVYTCVNCSYEPDKDLGKYPAIFKNGKMRIVLSPIAISLFICPKCKQQHITREFKRDDPKRDKRRLRQMQEQRIQKLKAIYHH